MHPEVFSPDKGDGVRFEIVLQDDTGTTTLFSRYIDPKNNPEDQKRLENQEIDPTGFGGKRVTLSLVTSPGPANNNAYD